MDQRERSTISAMYPYAAAAAWSLVASLGTLLPHGPSSALAYAAPAREGVGLVEVISDNHVESSNRVFDPDVTLNPASEELLVVWAGTDDGSTTPGLGENEMEIFAQRVDARSGHELGAEVRISTVGLDGDAGASAVDPAASYDAVRARYLVVWSANRGAGGQADGEVEIFGVVLDGANAQPVGPATRLSDNSPLGDPDYGQFAPDVSFGTVEEEYLVVWEGDTDVPGVQVRGEDELWGRFVNAAGEPVGSSVKLSDNGPLESDRYDAADAAVAYNPRANEFLVVWSADDDGSLAGGVTEGDFEIWAQRIDARTRTQIGLETLVSDLSPAADADFRQRSPVLAYNAVEDEYLVAWSGDRSAAGIQVAEEFEIHVRRLAGATGIPLAPSRQISDQGPVLSGGEPYDALQPAVAHDPVENVYHVAWSADDDGTLEPGLVDNDAEIFVQQLEADGTEQQPFEQRISINTGTGSLARQSSPALAYSPALGGSLVVWRGNGELLERDSFNVLGRVWRTAFFADGFETGDTFEWDLAVGTDG